MKKLLSEEDLALVVPDGSAKSLPWVVGERTYNNPSPTTTIFGFDTAIKVHWKVIEWPEEIDTDNISETFIHHLNTNPNVADPVKKLWAKIQNEKRGEND
ncbi:hypothetical protein LTR73_009342, partial [Friedmanniomyces endolithicus]